MTPGRDLSARRGDPPAPGLSHVQLRSADLRSSTHHGVALFVTTDKPRMTKDYQIRFGPFSLHMQF